MSVRTALVLFILAVTAVGAQRTLGEGYLVREDPARDGIRTLPRRARRLTVALNGPFPHIVVDAGQIRIVAVDLL